MKIKTYRNYNWETDTTKVIIPEETMTEPGQSLSPQQMFERFTTGRPINASPGYYEFGSEDETNMIEPMRDISRLDKLERAHYLRAIKREIIELKSQIDSKSTKNIENTIEDKATQLETEHNEEMTP